MLKQQFRIKGEVTSVKMFGDDFFGGGIDDLFKRLAGENSSVEYTTLGPDGKRKTTKRMQRDVFGKVLLDKISTKKRIYFVFDFSGKENVFAEIKDEIIENDYGERVATGKKVLEVKDGKEHLGSYPLSKEIRPKGYESNFRNGILEVSFKK